MVGSLLVLPAPVSPSSLVSFTKILSVILLATTTTEFDNPALSTSVWVITYVAE